MYFLQVGCDDNDHYDISAGQTGPNPHPTWTDWHADFPAAVPTYCVLRVEDVRGRRVVDDDDSTELPAQSAEVFDVVSSVENAGFPEEPGAEHPPLVQQVCHGIGILIGDGILGERRATALRYQVRRREADLG